MSTGDEYWCFNGDGGTKIQHHNHKQFKEMTEEELLDLYNMPDPGSFIWAREWAEEEMDRRGMGLTEYSKATTQIDI